MNVSGRPKALLADPPAPNSFGRAVVLRRRQDVRMNNALAFTFASEGHPWLNGDTASALLQVLGQLIFFNAFELSLPYTLAVNQHGKVSTLVLHKISLAETFDSKVARLLLEGAELLPTGRAGTRHVQVPVDFEGVRLSRKTSAGAWVPVKPRNFCNKRAAQVAQAEAAVIAFFEAIPGEITPALAGREARGHLEDTGEATSV